MKSFIFNRHKRPLHSSMVLVLLCSSLLLNACNVRADTNRFPLSQGNFSQDWSNPGLITTDNDWSGVPSIVGYNGSNVTAPRTNVDGLTGDYSASQFGGPAVRANQQDILVGSENGGVAEYEQNGSVALRGVNAATSAPHLIAYLDSRNRKDLKVSFDLIDIDGVNNTDPNAPGDQFIALQYRVGNSGKFTTVASRNNSVLSRFGPGNTGFKTVFTDVALPAPANNQSDVQIRIITADQIQGEDWLAVDNIVVSSDASLADPSVAPIANPDNTTTDEDTSVVIPLLDNDSDEDTPSADLKVGTISNVQGGQAVGVGTRSVTFTPSNNRNSTMSGTFGFDYNMVDPQGNFSNLASVTIMVAPINDAPVVNSLIATPLALVDGFFTATATARDPEFSSVTYRFIVRRPDGSELFNVQNTSGQATFNLASVSGEAVGDGLITEVTASDGSLTSMPVVATTFVTSLQVTTLDESSSSDQVTSLREAVTFANLYNDNSSISFAPTLRGTIILTQGQLILAYSTSITGPGARLLLVSGNSNSRHFLIRSGATVTLSGLSFIDGVAGDSGEFAGAADRSGGSLVNYGTLTLDDCAFKNNLAQGIYLPPSGSTPGGSGFSRGGALLNVGTLTVRGCLFVGNRSFGAPTGGRARGGAIDAANGATFSNCTFFGNSASGGPNADTEGGAIFTFGQSFFTNVSIVGNAVSNQSVSTPGGMFGGGIRGSGTLGNSIVAGNSRSEGPGSGTDLSGSFTGNSNLVGDTSGSTVSGSRNLLNISDPKLGPLADNGGPTDTLALLSGSVAIDAGNSTLTVDQRGFLRPQGLSNDIGAFEFFFPIATSGALINEFRVSGPNGARDEFIELYNQTNTSLNLNGWSVMAGSMTLPLPANLPVVPAYGRLLLTGSGYSLKDYGGTNAALGDILYSGDIAPGSTLVLRNASGTAVDTVDASSLTPPTSAISNYSYVRRMDGAGGAPQVGGDFNLVDVASTAGPNNTTGVSSNLLRLGAPGPQNLGSPIVANQLVKFTQTGFTRTGSGNSGTLIVRATVQNVSSRVLTSLRFRAVGLTAGLVDAGTAPADIRLSSSTSSDGTNLPLSLQNPPAQPNGGGLNATVSLGGLPNGGLAPNATVSVEFAFTIVKSGTFRYLLNLEPVTNATP